LILPNDQFLQAAETLRSHRFAAFEETINDRHHVDGLEQYAAQYLYPSKFTELLGSEITVALFPASFVGWKLSRTPMPDPKQNDGYITSLEIEKLPPLQETDVEQSFTQVSLELPKSDTSDAVSISSETTGLGADLSEDEFVIIPTIPPDPPQNRADEIKFSGSVYDIVDLKTDYNVGVVEIGRCRKILENRDAQLVKLEKGLYVPKKEGLRKSFDYARDFVRKDNAGGSKFAKLLYRWSVLVERTS